MYFKKIMSDENQQRFFAAIFGKCGTTKNVNFNLVLQFHLNLNSICISKFPTISFNQKEKKQLKCNNLQQFFSLFPTIFAALRLFDLPQFFDWRLCGVTAKSFFISMCCVFFPSYIFPNLTRTPNEVGRGGGGGKQFFFLFLPFSSSCSSSSAQVCVCVLYYLPTVYY